MKQGSLKSKPKPTSNPIKKGGTQMIYTVTFNPSLDYIVSVEDFTLGLTNRTSS